MPYQLCVLGCGTMGVAVLSGVLDNLQSPRGGAARLADDSGPSTPMGSLILDPSSNPDSLPDRFIATVNRAESAKKLRRTFSDLGVLGGLVQVRQAADNVKSVQESDVILLWSVPCSLFVPSTRGPADPAAPPRPAPQLQAPTRGAPPPPAGHVGRARGQAPHLDPRRHHHLDDARLGPRVVHRRAQHAQHAQQGALLLLSSSRARAPFLDAPSRLARTPAAQIREGMTVVSSLDPNEPKTPVQRDILMALFTPLGRCRFMDEKVRPSRPLLRLTRTPTDSVHLAARSTLTP